MTCYLLHPLKGHFTNFTQTACATTVDKFMSICKPLLILFVYILKRFLSNKQISPTVEKIFTLVFVMLQPLTLMYTTYV